VSAPEAAAATPAATEVLEVAKEETPQPVKLDRVLSPETRLRQRLNVVEQLVAQGLKQEALAELRSVAAEDRFDPQGFYNIAKAFARLDATDEAISAYRKALEQRKGHYSRAANNLGVVLLRQGFWDQAYEAFLLALRTENFHYAEASYNLGRLYAARGEMDRAVREWRRAVTVNPNHVAAAQALGSATPKFSSASSGTDGGVATAANASSHSSKPIFTLDTETHELLQQARNAHENRRYADAVEGFKRVIARQRGYFAPATLELSYSLMELGRNEEALAALLLVAEKDAPRFPITYYHLGRLYERRGDLQHAEENYLRATQAHQVENAQFLLNLSSVREKRGDYVGALMAMENYVKRKAQQGQKPEWSDARLKELRDKAASGTSPTKP
jgi:tetratricopeptide (TPR) repeat protein